MKIAKTFLMYSILGLSAPVLAQQFCQVDMDGYTDESRSRPVPLTSVDDCPDTFLFYSNDPSRGYFQYRCDVQTTVTTWLYDPSDGRLLNFDRPPSCSGDFWRFSQVSGEFETFRNASGCLLYTSPSPRDQRGSRMPSSA